MIHKGDKVKVIRIAADVDELTKEHISCFLRWTGTVKTEPVWFRPEPGKPLGLMEANGECWVEFDRPCVLHGESGALFEVSELEKVELE